MTGFILGILACTLVNITGRWVQENFDFEEFQIGYWTGFFAFTLCLICNMAF